MIFKNLLLGSLLIFSQFLFAQTANHLVISEIYGRGGNSGATYKNDFIELYNPTSELVNINGWSVHYASSTGASLQDTHLNGTIAAHGFYLVQEAKVAVVV